jgi:hypothetical protein
MKRLAALAPELASLAGAGLISYGAWLVYQPAGFIAAGAFLVAGAWLYARNGAA